MSRRRRVGEQNDESDESDVEFVEDLPAVDETTENFGKIKLEKSMVKDPCLIPTQGKFYSHDNRDGEDSQAKHGKREIRKPRKETDEGVWGHDKFEALEKKSTPKKEMHSDARVVPAKSSVPSRPSATTNTGVKDVAAVPKVSTQPITKVESKLPPKSQSTVEKRVSQPTVEKRVSSAPLSVPAVGKERITKADDVPRADSGTGKPKGPVKGYDDNYPELPSKLKDTTSKSNDVRLSNAKSNVSNAEKPVEKSGTGVVKPTVANNKPNDSKTQNTVVDAVVNPKVEAVSSKKDAATGSKLVDDAKIKANKLDNSSTTVKVNASAKVNDVRQGTSKNEGKAEVKGDVKDVKAQTDKETKPSSITNDARQNKTGTSNAKPEARYSEHDRRTNDSRREGEHDRRTNDSRREGEHDRRTNDSRREGEHDRHTNDSRREGEHDRRTNDSRREGEHDRRTNDSRREGEHDRRTNDSRREGEHDRRTNDSRREGEHDRRTNDNRRRGDTADDAFPKKSNDVRSNDVRMSDNKDTSGKSVDRRRNGFEHDNRDNAGEKWQHNRYDSREQAPKYRNSDRNAEPVSYINNSDSKKDEIDKDKKNKSEKEKRLKASAPEFTPAATSGDGDGNAKKGSGSKKQLSSDTKPFVPVAPAADAAPVNPVSVQTAVIPYFDPVSGLLTTTSVPVIPPPEGGIQYPPQGQAYAAYPQQFVQGYPQQYVVNYNGQNVLMVMGANGTLIPIQQLAPFPNAPAVAPIPLATNAIPSAPASGVASESNAVNGNSASVAPASNAFSGSETNPATSLLPSAAPVTAPGQFDQSNPNAYSTLNASASTYSFVPPSTEVSSSYPSFGGSNPGMGMNTGTNPYANANTNNSSMKPYALSGNNSNNPNQGAFPASTYGNNHSYSGNQFTNNPGMFGGSSNNNSSRSGYNNNNYGNSYGNNAPSSAPENQVNYRYQGNTLVIDNGNTSNSYESQSGKGLNAVNTFDYTSPAYNTSMDGNRAGGNAYHNNAGNTGPSFDYNASYPNPNYNNPPNQQQYYPPTPPANFGNVSNMSGTNFLPPGTAEQYQRYNENAQQFKQRR